MGTRIDVMVYGGRFSRKICPYPIYGALRGMFDGTPMATTRLCEPPLRIMRKTNIAKKKLRPNILLKVSSR